MDIDPSSSNETEEDVRDTEEKRQTAEHECAHAVACEVYGRGAERVSIEPTDKRLGWCEPTPVPQKMIDTTSRLACSLAGPAWDVVHYEDVAKRLQASQAIEDDLENVHQGDLEEAHARAEDADQLEEAWSASKIFVRDWQEVIEHLADLLMEKDADPDQDPVLDSQEIWPCVIDPSEFGLEEPDPSKYPLPPS